MTRHRRVPRLEALEAKTLLSDGMMVPTTLPMIPAPPPPHHHIALSGEVNGSWMIEPVPRDVGQVQKLTGSGLVQPLGAVSATCTLHAVGFIAVGRPGGTLTLSNNEGSVTLTLTGPRQRGFTGFSRHYTYKITASSGQFAGSTDSGTASLFEAVADPPVPVAGMPNLPIIVGPIFSLTLHSAARA